MTIALEDVSELIGEVYDAAVHVERWPAVLQRLGTLMGGAAFVMSALHRSRGMLLGVTTCQDDALSVILRTRYNSPRTNPLVAAMPRLPVGKIVARRTVYDDPAYVKGELYNEIFRPQELAHRAVACLHRDDALVCPFGVLRPHSAEDFSVEALRLLEIMLPHLQRGVRLTLQMKAVRNEAQRAAEALDRLALGVLLADEEGRIAQFNRAAERIFCAQDGLWLRNGELRTCRHADALALRAVLARAFACPQDPGGALLVHRRGGKRPYAVMVAPLGGGAALGLADAPRAAIVLVNDPDAAPPPGRMRLLRQLFGLSPREAQLAAALLDGKRLEAYAQEQAISLETVKTQLRAIFRKTDTSRQAQLMRVLSALPAVERP